MLLFLFLLSTSYADECVVKSTDGAHYYSYSGTCTNAGAPSKFSDKTKFVVSKDDKKSTSKQKKESLKIDCANQSSGILKKICDVLLDGEQ